MAGLKTTWTHDKRSVTVGASALLRGLNKLARSDLERDLFSMAEYFAIPPERVAVDFEAGEVRLGIDHLGVVEALEDAVVEVGTVLGYYEAQKGWYS